MAQPRWKPSWSVPAAMRAARATVVIPSLFAITDKIVADPQMALFATFGGFATLMIASFGGTRRDKLVAHTGLAIAGSLVGGYTTWGIGRKGGEAALHRYVPARLLGRVVKWVERHHILAVFLPAVLPPPIPLSPFLLASGALGVSRGRFLAIYGAARTLRYSLIAWLAVAYGRHAIHLWSGTLQKWSTPLMCVFAGVMVAGICFGIWKVRSLRKVGVTEKPTRQKAASRAS